MRLQFRSWELGREKEKEEGKRGGGGGRRERIGARVGGEAEAGFIGGGSRWEVAWHGDGDGTVTPAACSLYGG